MMDVFGDTPTGNQFDPPSTSFSDEATPFGCGCVRFAPLPFTPPHPKGVRRSNGGRAAAPRAPARAPAEPNYRNVFTPPLAIAILPADSGICRCIFRQGLLGFV